MIGKVCIITGGTSGIGKAASLALAQMGATTVIVGRNRDKGIAALREIKEKSGNNSVFLMPCDLSSQSLVRQLAKDLLDRFNRIDVLLNNAGIFVMKRTITPDGIESTFAVNHLAPFLLTSLLLDRLNSSAPARIVNTSSVAHKGAKINFDDIQGEKHYSGIRAYGQSKLANILFTYELARRLQGTGVTANCYHPGVIRTELGQDNPWIYRLILAIIRPFFKAPEEGADAAVYLASSSEVQGQTGKYFVGRRPVNSSKISYDESVAKRLWELSEELVHLQ
jgi:NAD(P)-dependent dehydrogenase (short-subunit alcohol dehydrogenase family)